MRRRVLQRRYGRALAPGYYPWRLHVEYALTERFKMDGMAPGPAREVAAGIVAQAKGLPRLHRQGVSPMDAAATLSPAMRTG
jgi:hypothetical protein